MCKLAVSLLELDYRELGRELEKAERAGVDLIHIDVMDGSFVPNLGIGTRLIERLRSCTQLPFDIHMMVREPEKHVERIVRAGADIVSVHQEACKDIGSAVDLIQEQGVKAGIVLKPGTSLEVLSDKLLEKADIIQLMTTEPGVEGQTFIPESIEKIRDLRRRLESLGLQKEIEIDGNVTEKNIGQAVAAGATIAVSGRALVQGSIQVNIRNMRRLMRMAGLERAI